MSRKGSKMESGRKTTTASASTTTKSSVTTSTTSLKVMEDLDGLLRRLLNYRKGPAEKPVRMKEEELTKLCDLATLEFSQEQNLIEPTLPLKICGDTHGQFMDVLRLFEYNGHPPKERYLFLGDYVDRGRLGIETISLMFIYKVKHPKDFFLLRGNHECFAITKVYGFYDECKRRFSERLYRRFCLTFEQMPVAALIENRIFCAHGGLSPSLNNFAQISLQKKGELPDFGLLCDLVWTDPTKDFPKGWAESSRGVSFIFAADVVKDFCNRMGIDLIVRAHQVVEDGYEFFAGRRLVTVFSAPNYCGEFDNAAAVLTITKDFHCSFSLLLPVDDRPTLCLPKSTTSKRVK